MDSSRTAPVKKVDADFIYILSPDNLSSESPVMSSEKTFANFIYSALKRSFLQKVIYLQNNKKQENYLSTLLSSSKEKILVFPIDSNTYDIQAQRLQELASHFPSGTLRIMMVVPTGDDVIGKVKALASEIGFFAEQDIQVTLQNGKAAELIEQIATPSRMKLLKDQINNNVIQLLIDEKTRLEQTYQINARFEPSPRITGSPGGTPEERKNAGERCAVLDQTIKDLQKELASIRPNKVITDEALKNTLKSFKDIIERDLPKYDKRKGNWINKMGRTALNALLILPLGIPLGIRYYLQSEVLAEEKNSQESSVKETKVSAIKSKIAGGEPAALVETKASGKAAKLGRKLGLTSDTGLFVRLEGKTAYEASNAIENIDQAFKEIRRPKPPGKS